MPNVSHTNTKEICYFGFFEPEFIRNAVLIRGFRENGYTVHECTVDPSIGRIKKFKTLYQKGKELQKTHNFSYVIIGFPGNAVVWLARLLFGRRIIFDAFLSQYDANVHDRKLYSSWHPRAWRDWFYDWYACVLAWRVLLPENVHIDYFVETFHLPREKFLRVFTGANDSIFYPRPEIEKTKDFTVHFHGTFIPLQGIDYIIEAARILKNEGVRFQIVGSGGSLFEEIQKKVVDLQLDNVDMLGRKPLEEVPGYIAQAHICLGVFGDTEKTQRVVSNKIYECIAMGASIITSQTPATEELLTNRENVLFAEPANGADLAKKIQELRNDDALRQQIARGARDLFDHSLTPQKLVAGLLEDLPNSRQRGGISVR